MTRHPRRGHRRLFRVVVLLCGAAMLAALAGGAYLWSLHLWASLEAYGPPIRVQPHSGGQETATLAPQVVVVLISGLRCDAVADMPTLSLLQREGASARAAGRSATHAVPAWATLLTGSWPELNGVPIVGVPEGYLGPIPADQLFSAARRANRMTALAGPGLWAHLVPEDTLDAHYYAEASGPAGDRQVTDTAIRFLRNFRPNLMLVHLSNLGDVASHAGANSPAYHRATLEIDDHLRDILREMDPQRSVLVVASDYGPLVGGVRGDAVTGATYTPFVATGAPIIPGNYAVIAQTDIAPTVAAILGIPMPRLAQGVIRFDMLRCDDSKRAETQAELALQRQEYADLYLHTIGRGALSDTSRGDVAVALSSLEVGNLESAYLLAGIAVDRIDREVAAARDQRMQRERNLRLPVAAAVVVAPLVLPLLRRSRRDLWLLFAALATLLAYHGLFLWQGGVFSLNALPAPSLFLGDVARRMGVSSALGALIVLWRLIHDGEGSVLGIVETSLGYSLAIGYLLACQAAVGYWLNGPRLTWYLPDLRVTFLQLTALAQAPSVVAIGFVLPAILLLAGVAYQGVLAASVRIRVPLGGR